MPTTYRAIHTANDGLPVVGQVVPFGRYGGGNFTAHPIGLVIVIGLLVVGFIGMPEARWFLSLAVPLGVVCGAILWLRHRE